MDGLEIRAPITSRYEGNVVEGGSQVSKGCAVVHAGIDTLQERWNGQGAEYRWTCDLCWQRRFQKRQFETLRVVYLDTIMF